MAINIVVALGPFPLFFWYQRNNIIGRSDPLNKELNWHGLSAYFIANTSCKCNQHLQYVYTDGSRSTLYRDVGKKSETSYI